MSQLPHCITSPPWWQLIQWIADPIGFQDKYSRKYGDIFTIQLGKIGSYVLIGNPQAVQEIFSQDFKFDAGRSNALAEPLVGQNSLMLIDGDKHRRERKLLTPLFHGERLQTYAQQICLITEQIINKWQVGQPFVARTEMQKISLDIILQIVFGLKDGEDQQQLKILLTDLLNMLDSPIRSSMLFFQFLQQDLGAWTPWGLMKQRQRKAYDLLQIEIDRRRKRQHEEFADVLSTMMEARDENGQAMTDEELKDELLTILFTGYETTATILSWALYHIHKQLDIREELLKEIDSLGKDLHPIEITQLPYLTAVCQETLRMYPVLPVIWGRMTKSPVSIAGYKFNAETILLPSNYLVHYREDLYPEPKQFKPKRFFERQYSPFEYFPFGGGSRRCLGYNLAQLEMKLVLATVLSKYQLALVDDKPVKMQRRAFALFPKGGVRMMMLEKR